MALSLTKTIKIYPSIGWVRANHVSNDELLVDINEIRKENQQLRKELSDLKSAMIQDNLEQTFADLSEYFTVNLENTVTDRHGSSKRRETISLTWTDIFSAIAPDLLEHPNDNSVNFTLGSSLYRKSHPESSRVVRVHHDDFQTIKIQLSALRLIEVSYLRTTKGDMALFWALTPRGHKLMVQLRTVKSAIHEGEEA